MPSVKIDSARKHGILLEAIQVLTDLDLSINKAYISSDGRWFMDVFHVTDQLGRKLADDSVISYIEQSLETNADGSFKSESGSDSNADLTALELTGTDRPGLLSEIFAVLADLDCNVADAKLWSHNGRIASIIFFNGDSIHDSHKIRLIEARLRNVLKGDAGSAASAVVVSPASFAHPDRRLHQMMFADRDYERASGSSRASVSVQNWIERGYSVVNVQCRDRPKLLFDVICTLTDMKYIVFHGTIDTDGDRAHQEFYIRHSDGSPISSEAERQRVIQCLQAAIERRASEGLKLELCAADRRGLLADITRTFRENGLSVLRAEVSTKDEMAVDVFHVSDTSGEPADPKTIDAVIERVGADSLKVAELRLPSLSEKRSVNDATARGGVGLFYIGSIVKRNLYNLGLIRSCS